MGWWALDPKQREDCDDVIGDPPVDRLVRALTDHARACDSRIAARPSLAGLLAALAEALRRRAAAWCGRDDAARFAAIEARVTRAGESTTVRSSAAFDHELVARLSDAFDDVAVQYDDAFDRPPQRHELLGVVAFALGAFVDRYLAEPGDLSVETVVVDASERDDARSATRSG